MKKCCNNRMISHPVMTGALLMLAGIGMYGVITTVKKRKSYMKAMMKRCTADCMQSCESMCSSVCECLCNKVEQLTSALSRSNASASSSDRSAPNCDCADNSCDCAPCDCADNSCEAENRSEDGTGSAKNTKGNNKG